jgi:hypothetical protein
VLALGVVVLAGCTALPAPGPAPEQRRAAPETEVAEQLVFLDRLAVADRDELAELGRGLRADAEADHAVALRYALWLSTPGHAGYRPERARRELEALLVEEPALERPLRALVRIRLRTLRARRELQETNARLTTENERLREQIRALTELEQRMGTGGE